MKRKLSERINWKPEEEEIENLDWKGRPEDFARLYKVVVERIDSRCGLTSVEVLMGKEVLERVVREAASRFEERHTSLPMFAYLKTKEFVVGELRKQKRP